ncbi:MAG TPA: YHS domain-containing protein [Blastocatellia bacterium]|nr:YHS domain-containing protein [Blastocatellia bacterium]
METHTDPVCGKQIDETTAGGESEYLGRKYYFCSEGCQHKFEQRPEDYVVKTGRVLPSADDR